MLTLVWRDRARRDLREIVDYISDRNIDAAEQLQAAIADCSERLPQFPFMYRAGRMAGTREAVVHPNYLLIYRVGVEVVEVINVIHARRAYP